MKYCMRGGLINGKEVVPGNSPKNDIYDVKLPSGQVIKGSGGEIVMDKETLAKGPEAWLEFIDKEMKKAPHLFKNHFWNGGQSTPSDSYVDQSKAQGLEPSWVDQLHDTLMGTPSRSTSDRRSVPTGSAAGSDVGAKKLGDAWKKAGYAKGGIVEGGREKVGVVMKEFYKKKLKSNSGALVKKPAQAKAIAMSEAGLSNNYSKGGLVKENEHPMAEGGEVNNSLTPENAFNHYLEGDGILGGTVYDGSTDEKFLFGPYCFDIDKARMISQKKVNGQIPVSPLWLDKVRLNPEHAQKSKSKNPVFIAQIQTPNGLKPLLIDGNHRMYKAVGIGEKSIDAYIFSPEETVSLFVSKPEDVEHPKDEGKQKFKDGGTVQPEFDPKAYIAQQRSSDFNPKEYIAQQRGSEKDTSMSDKLQTAGENYGQALTLGYLPQIQAAAQPVTDKIFGAITGEHPESESYVKSRDENIRRIEQESARNPKSALAGQAAGVAAGTALAPGIEGASTLGTIGNAAKIGGMYGFAQNPGDKPGEVSPLQLDDRIENAKTGVELGAAAGAAGSLIGKGIGAMKNSADAAQEFANSQAVKAGGGMLKDFRQLSAKGKLDEMGQFALDNKLVQAGDTVKDVASKADKFRQRAGQELDQIYSKASEAMKAHASVGVDGMPAISQEITGFNPAQNKDQILAAVGDKLGDSPAKAKAVSTVRKYLGQLERDYGDQILDPKKANDIKTAIDKEINYARNPLTKNPAAEEGYSVLRNYINDAVKSHVEQLGAASGDPQLAEKLAAANKNYGNARQFQSMAEDRIARENSHKMLGLTDTIAGTGGAAIGYAAGEHSGHGLEGAAAGFMAGMAHKTVGKYAPAAIASMANKAAPVLRNTAVPLSEFLARSPKDLATKAMLQEFMLNRKGNK